MTWCCIKKIMIANVHGTCALGLLPTSAIDLELLVTGKNVAWSWSFSLVSTAVHSIATDSHGIYMDSDPLCSL